MSHTCGHPAGFLLGVEVAVARQDTLTAPGWDVLLCPTRGSPRTDTAVNPEQAAACRALGMEWGCSCR